MRKNTHTKDKQKISQTKQENTLNKQTERKNFLRKRTTNTIWHSDKLEAKVINAVY